MGLSLLVASGCVETADDETLTGEGLQLDATSVAAGVAPDAEDDAVCQALARRARACHGGWTANESCASRFACSKQLWRPEIVGDVYACVEEQPCDVADPAMACLDEVGAELEPTRAQLDAERAVRSLDGQCDDMIDMAPGQTDEVYEIIQSCVEAEDSCDGVGTCVVLSLDALVSDVCSQMETI